MKSRQVKHDRERRQEGARVRLREREIWGERASNTAVGENGMG